MSDPNAEYLDELGTDNPEAARVFRGVRRERECDTARQKLAAQRTWEWQKRKKKKQQVTKAIERLSIEDARLGSVAALTRDYDAEPDPDERENIIRTIVEIVRNEPVIEREKRGGV